MSDKLSQEEIDALLNGEGSQELEEHEKDALGEIGNISMGTAATTLCSLIGKKVIITTPKVKVTDWETLSKSFIIPHVAIMVVYRKGIEGSNLMVLKEEDAKVIADLMMGGDGTKTDEKIDDIHLSAVSEAMNQMVGSASTSMSEMFNKRIEIHPPRSFVTEFDSEVEGYGSGRIISISFKMIIEDLIDSEIIQLIPIEFAKDLVKHLMGSDDGLKEGEGVDSGDEEEGDIIDEAFDASNGSAYVNKDVREEPLAKSSKSGESISVQPARFEDFSDGLISVEKKNISLIMDVPLEVTVELGRTQKLIKDILELSPGSIIELDKLAGEPVDILVNGKRIAKGEVVVIDESFGVRITDIVHPSKRL